MDDSFTTLDGVLFTIDSTSDLANLLINNLTALTDGGLTVLGGNYTFPNLADIDGSSLDVENGASLSLPGVTSETNGAGVNYGLPFFANGGGKLSLVKLATITGDGVNVSADGTGSTIDLSGLTTFDVNPAGGALFASNGGTIDLNANLTTINGANVYIDATSTITPLTQLTALTGGTLTLNGVDASNAFPDLATIDGLGILVEEGGSLSLPMVTSYTNNGYPFSESLQVQDPNSALSLPNLATITGNGVSIVASGTGSRIDVSGLTSFGTYNEGLSVTDGATVELNPALTSFDNLDLTLDGTGTLPIGQFTSLTGGTITIEGGNYTSSGPSWFSSLTDIDGTSLTVFGGGDLALGVTSYSDYWSSTFQVFGTNSVLDLSALTMIDGDNGVMSLLASGNGSEIDVSALTSLNTPQGGTLSVTQSGTILDGSLTALHNMAVNARWDREVGDPTMDHPDRRRAVDLRRPIHIAHDGDIVGVNCQPQQHQRDGPLRLERQPDPPRRDFLQLRWAAHRLCSLRLGCGAQPASSDECHCSLLFGIGIRSGFGPASRRGRNQERKLGLWRRLELQGQGRRASPGAGPDVDHRRGLCVRSAPRPSVPTVWSTCRR